MAGITIQNLKAAITKLGYVWYDDMPNLIGIRTSTILPNKFNDRFALVWKQPELNMGTMSTLATQKTLNDWLYTGENGLPLKEDGSPGRNTRWAQDDYNRTKGQERLKVWTITTLPGLPALLVPENPKGTALMKPGQYVGAYTFGYHNQTKNGTSHPCLRQTGPITVYRDKNKNGIPEPDGTEDTGVFSCNIHRSNRNGATPVIGPWSAGCQVFQIKSDLDQLLRLCQVYIAMGKTKFTYTLIKDTDLPA